MSIEEVLKLIDYNIAMCRFNLTTGEQELTNRDLKDLANACEVLKDSYKQCRADVIDECIKAVNDHCGGLPNPRIISCLEQLKEKNECG